MDGEESQVLYSDDRYAGLSSMEQAIKHAQTQNVRASGREAMTLQHQGGTQDGKEKYASFVQQQAVY